MKVYLVRTIEDKTAYGIFWVEDPAELFSLIDEKDDPGEYEFSLIEDGGGIFFADGYAKWKLGVKADLPAWEEDEGDTAEKRYDEMTQNITFSDRLYYALSGQDRINEFVPLSTLLKGAT